MELKELAGKAMMAAWQDEIERAIDSAKRTKLDRRMRAEWHRARARDHWSERRKAKWMEWKREHSAREAGHDDHGSGPARAAGPKVWIKGRVPKEFLDWIERHWSHDNETRAMLVECCFEVWERGGWPPVYGHFVCHIENKGGLAGRQGQCRPSPPS